MKRETTEQLDIFRKHQEEADKVLLADGEVDERKAEGSPEAGESTWAVNARKRKRVKEEGLKGIKLRKSSSTAEAPRDLRGKDSEQPKVNESDSSSVATLKEQVRPSSQSQPAAASDPAKPEDSKPVVASTLGLAGYSSDEEE